MSPADQVKAVYQKHPNLPDVTCVAPNFRLPGLVLGFEDGTIIFTAADGHVADPVRVSPTGEAINGIAGVGSQSLAVSTRSDVSFFQSGSMVSFPGGAHGVVATRSGSYVAPLGPKGLLIVHPTNAPVQEMRVTKGTEGELYFYRAAALHDQHGTETLIFANRKSGVGLSVFNRDERYRVVHTMGFKGIDVVDVCGVEAGSLSAVAISKTADLLWIKDTSQTVHPVVIRPTDVKGVVYRVLATSRHLFVLTSEALYTWFNLIGRALLGQFASPDTVRLVLPINAIDMSLINNQHLLFVMGTNSITSLELTEIEDRLEDKTATQFGSAFGHGSFEKTSFGDIHQDWRTEDVTQHDLVAAV